MTEEKADQIIRCVKECWWRVLLVIAIPACIAAPIAVGELPSLQGIVNLAVIVAALGTVGALFVAIKAPTRLYDEERSLQQQNQKNELLALQQVMHDVANQLFKVVGVDGYISALFLKLANEENSDKKQEYEEDIQNRLEILSVLLRQYMASLERVSWDVYPKTVIASELISFLNIMRFYIEGIDAAKHNLGAFNDLYDRAQELDEVLLSVHKKVGEGEYNGPKYGSRIKWRRAKKV